MKVRILKQNGKYWAEYKSFFWWNRYTHYMTDITMWFDTQTECEIFLNLKMRELRTKKDVESRIVVKEFEIV